MLSILSPRIEPGAMWKLTINLAEYFELAKPGNYFVSVRRHYSWRGMHSDGKVVPKQNPNDPKAIPFTVTP